MNVNLKVEGLYKSSLYHDSSTEEEGERTGQILPPLKQSGAIQLETKFVFNTMAHPSKKKDESKKLSSTNLKPTFSNQHLYSKFFFYLILFLEKSMKGHLFQAPEYLVVGRKAN